MPAENGGSSAPDLFDLSSIDSGWLRGELVRPGSLWRSIQVVAQTGSTNADLAAAARSGAATAGSVLATGYQTAGRGRRDRRWSAPPGTSVAVSLLVAPHDVPTDRWGWLPLLAGLAVVEGLRRITPVDVTLKWPNDVMAGDRKLCGILAERVETPDRAGLRGRDGDQHLVGGRAAAGPRGDLPAAGDGRGALPVVLSG